ncbi:hypothetical protein [Streptomyces telluris]|uniref:Uncharacterized protein n=1 Tax=Streptomyces telluris TaxID=2720021 RepID=A0A9X2RKG9_9ACTN|nr:hypothetical protein [Streptomyces telluris]MCQ8769797.1 hypothetical protein [Streptomyces telluris]NJP78594.1 hypothetical protein [Streptomyces telluris]
MLGFTFSFGLVDGAVLTVVAPKATGAAVCGALFVATTVMLPHRIACPGAADSDVRTCVVMV